MIFFLNVFEVSWQFYGPQSKTFTRTLSATVFERSWKALTYVVHCKRVIICKDFLYLSSCSGSSPSEVTCTVYKVLYYWANETLGIQRKPLEQKRFGLKRTSQIVLKRCRSTAPSIKHGLINKSLSGFISLMEPSGSDVREATRTPVEIGLTIRRQSGSGSTNSRLNPWGVDWGDRRGVCSLKPCQPVTIYSQSTNVLGKELCHR